MTDNQVSRAERQQPAKACKEKKLYQKPAFRHERVFETLALTCGKVNQTVSTCHFSTKTS
jgi:hypothetical protein